MVEVGFQFGQTWTLLGLVNVSFVVRRNIEYGTLVEMLYTLFLSIDSRL